MNEHEHENHEPENENHEPERRPLERSLGGALAAAGEYGLDAAATGYFGTLGILGAKDTYAKVMDAFGSEPEAPPPTQPPSDEE